jgi:hypothetical protein
MAVRRSSHRSKLAADALDHGTAAAGFDVGLRLAKGTTMSTARVAKATKRQASLMASTNGTLLMIGAKAA